MLLTEPSRTRHRLPRAIAASVLLGVVLLGLPILLIITVGWPLPDHVPNLDELGAVLTRPLDNGTLLDVLAVLGWIAWLLFLRDVIFEVLVFARSSPVTPHTGSVRGPFRLLAALLIGAVAGAVASSSPTQLNASAGPPVTPASTTQTPTSQSEPSKPSTYEVERGDSLWKIADNQLDDPLKWTNVYDLNRDKPQDDGSVLTDPDLIRPGWRLHLPIPEDPVVEPPTVSTQAPSPTSPPGTPTSDAPAAPTSKGINLPTGGYVATALAAAFSTIAVLIWRRRRRDPSTRDSAEAELQPLPQIVAALHQAHTESPPAAEYASISEEPSDERDPVLQVPFGTNEDKELALAFDQHRLIGLTGPGAAGAARALLATLLADPSLASLVTTGNDLGELADQADVPEYDDLLILPTLAAALDELETELLRRERDHESRHPLILLTTLPEVDAPRLQAIVEQDTTNTIGAIVLGQSPDLTLRVSADGTVNAVGQVQGVDVYTGCRAYSISANELHDLLATLAQKPVLPAEPELAQAPEQPATAAPLEDQPHPRPISAASGSSSSALALTLIGPAVLRVNNEPAYELQPKLLELLAYLAINRPDAVNADRITEDLWPNSPPASAAQRLHTTVSRLRKTLRTLGGNNEADHVQQSAGRYRINPNTITCDLWDLESALNSSQSGDHDSLRKVADLCTAPLASGDFGSTLWIEQHRERLRRRVVSALIELADLEEPSTPESAVRAIEQAISHAPYDEPLYQRACRLHRQLGHTHQALVLEESLERLRSDLD